MESNLSKDIKVGLFALLGVILFCVSVILLGGGTWLFTKSYQLRVHLPQVQGLASGSVVSLTGVPVGNVTEVRFIENSSDVEVFMKLDSHVQSRITEGSKASVKTQGALGDKYIYIEPGPMGSSPLPDGALLESDRSPDFLDVIAGKGAEMGEVINIIKEVRILFENINRNQNSAHFMSNMVAASGELSKFASEAREVLVPMKSVMRKIDSGQGTLGGLINDPTLLNRINGYLGEQPRNRFLKPLIRESIETHEKQK